MDDKIVSRRTRSTQYIYNQYVNRENKNHIEEQSTFRLGFSSFSVIHDHFISQNCEKWNSMNFGGVPVDFDPSTKTVYIDSSDAHTLLIGATGSKKSRLVVMPTVRILASAGEDMIISDPKGEIYHRTAEYLEKKGYYINVINLRNPRVGDKWNFLAIPYQEYISGNIDKACEMVNDAAVALMPIHASDPYWDYTARDLFVGLVLLLFKICLDYKLPVNTANMRNVLFLRSNMFFTQDSKKIQDTQYWKEAEKSEFIKTKLIGTVVCPEKTLSCILSTFDQHVSCFSLQPQLIEMLSSSTVNFGSFGYGKRAIFIILPDEKTTYHKLVTIFIKQTYEFFIKVTYDNEKENRFPTRVNFILDEFSSLPCINDFPQMIVAARSRNIRFHLVMQSKNQLKQRYKNESETIQSNCANWMFLYTREIELLREISSLGGTKGKEELIPVSRLQHLDKQNGECLIFSGRKYPYYAHLADIDEYDGGNYSVLPIKKIYNDQDTVIDFDHIFTKQLECE